MALISPSKLNFYSGASEKSSQYYLTFVIPKYPQSARYYSLFWKNKLEFQGKMSVITPHPNL